MSRNHRVRTRILRMGPAGYVVRTIPSMPSTPPAYEYSGPYQMGYEECDDWVGGVWVPTPFDLKRAVFPQVSANGVHFKSGIKFEGVGVPLFSTWESRLSKPWLHYNVAPISDGALALMALANMNPNKPQANLPVSLAELRELPALLHDAGDIAMNGGKGRRRSGAKAAARANLIGSFGIGPILSDLALLLDFADAVDKREKYLRELASSKGRRFRRKLTTENWVRVTEGVAFSSWMDIYVSPSMFKLDVEVDREYWFTARAGLLNPPLDRELHTHAFRTIFGLEFANVSDLWEILPWTWLIDWFSTTGSLVAALRGGLTWQYRDICTMHRTTYTLKGSFPYLSGHVTVNLDLPEGTGVVKHRALPAVSLLPEFRTPFLTGKQWGILGSLFVLRIR